MITFLGVAEAVAQSWFVVINQEVTELDMEQQTGSKSGKEYIKAVYCHPAYLT